MKSSTAIANDSGLTKLQKLTIVGAVFAVILVAGTITAITIISIVPEALRDSRNSAAQRTLRAAHSSAQSVYGMVLPAGQSNFAATAVSDEGVIGNSLSDASRLAVRQLRNQEPNIDFVSKFNYGPIAEAPPSHSTVWVFVTGGELTTPTDVAIVGTNPNGFGSHNNVIPKDTTILPGKMIILGVVAETGDSYCVVTVTDSTNDGIVSGEGYQSVTQENTGAGYGADCGAEHLAKHTPTTTDLTNAFKEMPQTAGTDPILSTPINITSTAYTN